VGEENRLDKPLHLRFELEQEAPDRWIADVVDLPGVMAYGATAFEAVGKAKLLAIDVVADRLANGEDPLTGLAVAGRRPLESAAEFGGIEFDHVPLAG
jgi:hypothetical protein